MQTNIGYMYLNGYGVTQNYQEALKWDRLAADQGNAAAEYSLDVMYGNGKGVTQDYQEALKWDRLAADQGDAVAASDATGPSDYEGWYAYKNGGMN